MAKTELNKKTSEFIVTVEAKKENWSKKQAESEKHLLKNVQVKGFRKGNVPLEIAKKHISQAEVFSHAISATLKDLAEEAAKEIKEDLLILDGPTYAVDKVDEKELVVRFIYPVYPHIELADYSKLDVKYEENKADDELVKQELEKIQESQSMLKDKDGKIAKGDVVVFDFEGFKEGKPFDGGKAEKFQLEIGSGQFIPGFEDQMIGIKKDEEKDINVSFPEDYHVEDLKGKPVVFKVKIHEIKSKVKPELNDEFAKSTGAPKVETLAELKKYIKEVFTEQYRQQARAKFQREAFDKIIEKTELNLPVSIVLKEMQMIANNFEQRIKQQGMTIDNYMKYTGLNRVQLDVQFRTQAEQRIKDALIFAEIAKKEKIELTDAEYDKEYEKLAKVYNQSIDAIKGTITKAQMQVPMTNDRVLDALIKHQK